MLYGALPATVAVQTALAGQVVEVVTLKLRAGVAAAEFAPIDKAVEREHVAKQPGFVSRERAWRGRRAAGDRPLAIGVFADASMASFQKAPAAAQYMLRIEASTMSMKRDQG